MVTGNDYIYSENGKLILFMTPYFAKDKSIMKTFYDEDKLGVVLDQHTMRLELNNARDGTCSPWLTFITRPIRAVRAFKPLFALKLLYPKRRLFRSKYDTIGMCVNLVFINEHIATQLSPEDAAENKPLPFFKAVQEKLLLDGMESITKTVMREWKWVPY